MAKVADIASAIIFLAMIAVIIKSNNTAGIVKNLGNAFSGSIYIAEQG